MRSSAVVEEIGRDDATLAGKTRHVRDSEGRSWLVRELQHLGYDRRSTSSLLFERHDVIRRVRNFPENWMTLGDADLFALSNGR
jgi:hypothetical protein